MNRKLYRIHAGRHVLDLGRETKVMGIINVTPDSFSKDGCWNGSSDAIKVGRLAARMIRNGAHILDVGGESSRPGAAKVGVEEELRRVIPVVKMLSEKFNVPVSVDTYKARVAREALEAGATIVNLIKGVRPDRSLLKAVHDRKAAIILMHMRGTPPTMQKKAVYRDVVKDVVGELKFSVKLCLDAGIHRNQIIIDPGIGFSKTVEHNLQILKRLREFERLGCPVLIGVSRKSFIGHVLNQPVDKRLAGSLAAACAAVVNGAHIVRVHDAAETISAVRTVDAILNSPL